MTEDEDVVVRRMPHFLYPTHLIDDPECTIKIWRPDHTLLGELGFDWAEIWELETAPILLINMIDDVGTMDADELQDYVTQVFVNGELHLTGIYHPYQFNYYATQESKTKEHRNPRSNRTGSKPFIGGHSRAKWFREKYLGQGDQIRFDRGNG